MKEIDWSRAPEDATHYLPTDVNRCWSACWYKQNSFGRWLGKNASNYDKGWNDEWAIDDDQVEAFVPTLIARPSSNWNGKGDPPVGTVCGYSIQDGGWFECEIKYVVSDPEKDYTQFVVYCPHLGYEQIVSKSYCKFRPIKTQEQIAAEEREKAIDKMMSLVEVKTFIETRHLVGMMYDVGYRLTKTEE